MKKNIQEEEEEIISNYAAQNWFKTFVGINCHLCIKYASLFREIAMILVHFYILGKSHYNLTVSSTQFRKWPEHPM